MAEFAAATLARVGVTDWESHIETDRQHVRPADATELVGDPSRVRPERGWQTTIDFTDLVSAMVDYG